MSVICWWLSRYDANLSGENSAADLRRRIYRCGITLILMAVGVGVGGFVFVAVIVPVAIIWTGCLSEFFARSFHKLIDSPGSGDSAPDQLTTDLDRLAALVEQGDTVEALALVTRLVEAREGSSVALEVLCFRIYDEMLSAQGKFRPSLLVEARQFEEQGKCLEAESCLSQLLAAEPRSLPAALRLMRLYARDLHAPGRAYALLQAFEHRSRLPPKFSDYARARIGEWVAPDPGEANPLGIESLLVDPEYSKGPETSTNPAGMSVADLLSSGRLGTAIEILEMNLSHNPGDFDSWLQLAEAHAVYCCNINKASEIVAKIEANAAFRPEQIRVAKEKLQAWRTRLPGADH